ncbi:MAG: molybdenum ABC transporter ATP-binding protein [Rhodospirillaceae bacterium]|jgi:molybdate transport system ATP-binding protein|nr:molybdenum ABC transporter ATP-binding protein [Rhodospirillaceae bacterium]MBT5666325.1 molybdenum ABC transporter ATP-binding protein [Rhodospirillaceae bacterium]MBT5812579.1 molybdenum ABC transporter ATP-binding protein [Rhodospirillaceae bacterium]
MSHLIAKCAIAYPDFRLNAALDLSIDGVTAVFGPSGSGKSTLLRLIAGLDRRAGNIVCMDGETWQDDAAGIFAPPHQRQLGFVFQEARLFPHLSVRANIGYGVKRKPAVEGRFDFDQVVDAFDLRSLLDRRPQRLSGGERQRVAIARAVMTHPRLLLMDEPLSSLDLDRKDEILPLIERLGHDFGIPVLYVSHAIDEVLRLASQLVLLSGGAVLAAGPIEDVTNRLDLHPYTGRIDAGAVLRATVSKHDSARGLTEFAFTGGVFRGPTIDAPVGQIVNLRIRSRDVALSLERPEKTSILNILPGRVTQVEDSGGPHAHVLLDVGSPLWARVMKVSARELGLVPGKPVYAMIKAVAVDRRSMGRTTAMDASLTKDTLAPPLE